MTVRRPHNRTHSAWFTSVTWQLARGSRESAGSRVPSSISILRTACDASEAPPHTPVEGKAMVLRVDLHPIFRSDQDIDRAVREAIFKAAGSGEDRIEIICGKGSGKLKNRVLSLLRRPHVRKLCRNVVVDPENNGRLLVHVAAKQPPR